MIRFTVDGLGQGIAGPPQSRTLKVDHGEEVLGDCCLFGFASTTCLAADLIGILGELVASYVSSGHHAVTR